MSYSHFVGCWGWNVSLFNFAGCLSVVWLVYIKVLLGLLLQNYGHSLSTRFVSTWPRDELLFEGDTTAHAALGLRIDVKAMNSWLQQV